MEAARGRSSTRNIISWSSGWWNKQETITQAGTTRDGSSGCEGLYWTGYHVTCNCCLPLLEWCCCHRCCSPATPTFLEIHTYPRDTKCITTLTHRNPVTFDRKKYNRAALDKTNTTSTSKQNSPMSSPSRSSTDQCVQSVSSTTEQVIHECLVKKKHTHTHTQLTSS